MRKITSNGCQETIDIGGKWYSDCVVTPNAVTVETVSATSIPNNGSTTSTVMVNGNPTTVTMTSSGPMVTPPSAMPSAPVASANASVFDTNGYSKTVLQIFKTGFALEIVSYLEAGCKTPVNFTGLKYLGKMKKSSSMYQMTAKRSNLLDLVMINYDASVNQSANEQKDCGKTDWVVGVPFHAMGTECAKAVSEPKIDLKLSNDGSKLMIHDCYAMPNSNKENCENMVLRRHVAKR